MLVLTSEAADSNLDDLISALAGGVTNLPVDKAMVLLEDWENRLATSSDAQLQGLSGNLADLRSELTSGAIDPTAIGRLMADIGSTVQEYSISGNTVLGGQLMQLGDILVEEGNDLFNGVSRASGHVLNANTTGMSGSGSGTGTEDPLTGQSTMAGRETLTDEGQTLSRLGVGDAMSGGYSGLGSGGEHRSDIDDNDSEKNGPTGEGTGRSTSNMAGSEGSGL